MTEACPLDFATWALLVTTAREDLGEWLGQRPGWSDLNCFMEVKKWRECLVTSLLRGLAERDSREMGCLIEGMWSKGSCLALKK